jgi:hypothetical protein
MMARRRAALRRPEIILRRRAASPGIQHSSRPSKIHPVVVNRFTPARVKRSELFAD